MRSFISGLVVLIVIVVGNLAVWAMMNRPQDGLPWQGTIRGLSFSPYQKDDNPLQEILPKPDEIDRDLKLLDGKVESVRTYTALEGMDVIPSLAAKYGMKVIAGAWVDNRLVKNEAELNTLIDMARNNRNIDRVIVGNEAVLKELVTVPQLTRYIRRVREQIPSRIQISTAEPWHVWLEHPELAREVDFITIHILPYWEGISVDDSMAFLMDQYNAVRNAFPNKPVFIGEVGWPSAGKTRRFAEPSLVNQALFLRRFLNTAAQQNIDYNIVEAFDQPWKQGLDAGTVEAYWGVFDADRNAKFSWVGPVVEFKEWPFQAAAATFLALLPVAFFLFKWKTLRLPGKIFYGVLVQFAASLVIWSMSVPMLKAFAPSSGLMFTFLMPAQVILLIVVLISGWELTELTWKRLHRKFVPFTPDTPKHFPKVSLHLPICNEPAHMVKLTLDSLSKLDYPNFEVLVIDNNTKDPEVWRPVEAYCAELGPRFRFFSLGKWPGFKAGALNFGLRETAPDAEVIGIIDADYIVDKNWLRSCVPYFDNPKTGWVQAPQDHREWEDDTFKEWINWEYAGFFDIGMVARNEANAIIQHGTMTLIRKKALTESGNWAEWCICEDAELGLRMLRDGYESVYLDHRFGHGLVPDTFTAYKKQRFRWAFGAVQILKGHWKSLVPFKKTGLTTAQKYHFITGWLPWFADAFYLLFTMASLFWSVGMVVAPRYFDFPLAIFVLPTVGVFVAKLLHHLFLYQTRVKCSLRQRLGSAVAGMALTYSIARAMWQGIFTKSTPFLRTPKCADKTALSAGFLMARDETILMLLQWAAAAAVLFVHGTYDPDARMWALVLFVQALPYAAALVTSIVSALPPKSVRKAKKKKTPAVAS